MSDWNDAAERAAEANRRQSNESFDSGFIPRGRGRGGPRGRGRGYGPRGGGSGPRSDNEWRGEGGRGRGGRGCPSEVSRQQFEERRRYDPTVTEFWRAIALAYTLRLLSKFIPQELRAAILETSDKLSTHQHTATMDDVVLRLVGLYSSHIPRRLWRNGDRAIGGFVIPDPIWRLYMSVGSLRPGEALDQEQFQPALQRCLAGLREGQFVTYDCPWDERPQLDLEAAEAGGQEGARPPPARDPLPGGQGGGGEQPGAGLAPPAAGDRPAEGERGPQPAPAVRNLALSDASLLHGHACATEGARRLQDGFVVNWDLSGVEVLDAAGVPTTEEREACVPMQLDPSGFTATDYRNLDRQWLEKEGDRTN
eukprot:GHVU01219904.1.p1 GENE.GHVU01219904.1~~GHVU01219904.1.p1  ORF type:complete len:366 (+),score=73.78 GHVU01219904.1:134-1231(+)